MTSIYYLIYSLLNVSLSITFIPNSNAFTILAFVFFSISSFVVTNKYVFFEIVVVISPPCDSIIVSQSLFLNPASSKIS